MRMQRGVMGNERPSAVSIFMELGRPTARLANNVVEDWHDAPEDMGEPQRFYRWDEATFETELTRAEMEDRFEELWYEAERASMSDSEWRADVESALLDIMEAIV